MRLEDFKDLISAAKYKTCETKMEKNPTWYPLTLDIFVKFLYKVIPLFFSFLFILSFHTLPFVLIPHSTERNIECGRYCSKDLP
jgi:hypothetical protein